MILLASASSARRILLTNAGLDFECCPAQIDERRIADALERRGAANEEIALELARQKALHISAQKPGALVIGADQILVFENRILSKAKTNEDALQTLMALSGKTHSLVSAVCAASDHDILWSHTDSATLTMHPYNEAFLRACAARDPDALTQCVGAYRIEGPGAWLFEKIEGDIFTIMGLPLLPLLAFLRAEEGITP